MRNIIHTIIFILSIQVVIQAQDKQKVDLIVTNAKIYTMDAANTMAQALAVKGGKVTFVGSSPDVLRLYASDQVVDAKGAPLFPGFIDAHCHFFGYALGLEQIDLLGMTSFDAIVVMLKSKAKEYPGDWIVGRGWDQNLWKSKQFPDRKRLDEEFPNRPVVLIRVDGHVALANGEALRRAGIGAHHRFQAGEVEVKDGWLTGIVSETAADHMREAIPLPDVATRKYLLQKAQNNCFAAGLTSVGDAGLETYQVRLIKSMQDDGQLKIRVNAMLSPSRENIFEFVNNGVLKSDHLSVRSIKLYSDGSLGSRTARLKAPYSDDSSKVGILVNTPDTIRYYCKLAKEHGYQVNVHAIGDSAVKMVLTVYGEFLKGQNDLRWRIEHAQVVDPADYALFHDFSVIPSVQATHATSDMYWAESRLGPKRVKGAYAYKDLLKQNGWIANGTDFPIEHISPIYTFYAAVVRKDLKGYPAGGFQMENALTRKEALQSITIWAAKSAFEENEKGSIEVGKFADFVILDHDLMTVPEAEMASTQVKMTFVGGEKVYEKAK